MLIRLLSLNIWDLPFSFPGSNRRERHEHLLKGLAALDADVVVIQEAFNPPLRSRIRTALPRHDVDARASLRGGRIPFLPGDASGGLLTLSRWPVTSTRMARWRYKRLIKLDEQFARKGALWTEIRTPLGALLVCNVHTHAGQVRADAEARMRQIEELLADPSAAHAGPFIIAGDLNIDPAVSPDNVPPNGFDLLRAAGFTEIGLEANAGLGTVVPATNRYARVGIR
ncbi:MAG TPA: endonuclease/exonuclease/phosphatase family protein, partial [Gemmatimonadales bacterium]